ncbi:E3 ubiquitin-protein ligase listerin isoform X2 [Drosophila hydei]|uniref:E3 ubiquitin-protein ligase listerin n=1 Tax=Drosophila hydei TaxID=7224 RepID=A0A6J2SS41_DROHY|nr:E3 ubiquitin-protein ligase listerin isoform X2 [Drosophila hydei]
MGGKTKQTPRTKNNAKPSSSSRTAELLGTTAPIFVGFSAQADGNLVPFAPGFSSAEQMPETFDASISPQTQIILRKLSKKDPLTKKKALQELHELITESDLDALKNILPLWPKFYHNLANDVEHAVREQTQIVQQLLVSKCKRAMAPYLKQLVPVWLASRYDSYAPAASIASNSFRETFARSGEVCLHCESEIIEYCTRNLTFHTPATLSIGKSLKPEEAEQKYQRVVIGSLKVLAFFIEQTSQTAEHEKLKEGLTTLLAHQKFWTFAKHKVPVVKAAWFDCIYHILQCANLLEVLTPQKSQLITTSFQLIDDADPLVAPHVWGCVLLLQSNYADWYSPLNIRKALLPKLSSLLRNAFNRNAQAICPNLLPFLSKITAESLQDLDLYEFYQRFFDDLKSAVVGTHEPPLSKADISIIHNAYFECLRFMLQQINNNAQRTAAMEEFGYGLLEHQLLEPIGNLLHSESNHVKYFFQHTSALVAFWDRECNTNSDKSASSLYVQLLNKFWTRIFDLVTQDLAVEDVNEQLLSHVLLLVQDLHVANPSLETQSVKFVEVDEEETTKVASQQSTPTRKAHDAAAFIQKELKQLVVKLVRICLDKASSSSNSARFIRQVRTLTKMFTDAEFYKSLTERGELHATLDKFVSILGKLNDDACESVVDILFEILSLQEPVPRFEYIGGTLLKIQQDRVQNLLLHRLLSYPLCTEPAVRQMLASPDTCEVIRRIAEEVVVDNNRDKLNLLHKCFFQTDTGDILINASTVDNILLAMCQPLEEIAENDMIEVCGSFIAQIMPVICSKANSSLAVRQKVFLKLFKFSLEQKVSDYLSEDTLWEITTCWQDALSSKDIEINDELLHSCARIVEELVTNAEHDASSLQDMAETVAKFIICSTENIEDETQRLSRIDETLVALLSSELKTNDLVLQFEQHSVYLEAVHSSISAGIPFNSAGFDEDKVIPLVRRAALNFTTICKLVCRVDSPQLTDISNEGEDELTEDYCDPNANLLKQWSECLIVEMLQCMHVASAADAWLELVDKVDAASEEVVLFLSEQLCSFLGNVSELVEIIKERLQQEALQQNNVIIYRLLGYLINTDHYESFEENATILLHEDLAELFLSKGAINAYVLTMQHLLPKLAQNSINWNSAIMRTEPSDMWSKAAVFRSLLLNNFESDENKKTDHQYIASAVQYITRIGDQQSATKELLHYNVELLNQSYESVINTVEIIKLLNELLLRFPYELTIKNWDTIRIGLGSWVLTVSKSMTNYKDPKTSFFIVAVFQLFATLISFIRSEKQKSSTELLKNVIDEWESLFAREVNVVLFKSYYKLTHEIDVAPDFRGCYAALLERILPALELMDYSFIYGFCKVPHSTLSLDHLCNFLLKQLHSSQHSVRLNSVHALRQLTPQFVADDIELNDKQSDNIEAASSTISKWHFLNRFEDYLNRYDALIRKYLPEFSFKVTELEDLEPIDRHNAYSYLLIWDCIINCCAKSPVALRSVYTSWLNENHYEENFLHFLFRAMPVDILKNHSAKVHSNGVFKELTWSQLQDPQLSVERYACHLYTEVLRKLPAVVRKWWNTSQSRQKNFVDNLTSNYVSALICSEELKAIVNRKEKHENMQYVSSRVMRKTNTARMQMSSKTMTMARKISSGTIL